MNDLEQRIIGTLGDDTVTAASLAELVAETESAITAADAVAVNEREKVMDPLVCSDPKAAREALEAAEIERGRLLTLQPRLLQRYQQADEAEDRAEWQLDFTEAAQERNALAKELRDTYPATVAALANLFARIADNDAALSRLHQARPSSAKGFLRSAELEARQLEEFSRDCPSLLQTCVLPEWVNSNKRLWPPRSIPAAVLLAESVATVHDPRRHSAHWHEVLAQDTERRVAEEARGIKNEEALKEADRVAYEASLPR